MRKFRSTPLHALLAAAVLALLVMPLAFAGAAPKATSSGGAVTAAKFKQLKQRIARLESRQAPATPTTPTGPAGGDLTGTYPNPTIGPNAIASAEVTPDTLAAVDLAPDSVGASETAPDGVGTSEIASDSVGGDELKGMVVRVSAAGVGSNNTFVDNSVTCANGEVLLGGGFAWQADATISMTSSAPSDTQANTWVARGRSATSNTLYAWASCLAV